MIPNSQFATLLDFSQWELAIQAFFCDLVQGGGVFVAPPANASGEAAENWKPVGQQVAFFTGFQAQIFTLPRPRVDLGAISHTEIPGRRIVDANGRIWPNAWSVPLDFFVITRNDYATHMSYLANVRAIIQAMNPIGIGPNANIQGTGLNAFLTTHELAQIRDAGGQTFGGKWTGNEGWFLTPLKYTATFAVAATSWPGGTLNT